MTDEAKARIGFVSCGPATRPHYRSLGPIVPTGVRLDFRGLELYRDDLYEIEGKKDAIVKGVRDLQNEFRWDGIVVTAAPPEVLNPGLFADLQAALEVPVTTALKACVAALRAFSAKRVLLLTPFDGRLNGLIREHLEGEGIAAVAPHPFAHLAEAMRLSPDEVFALAKRSLAGAGPVDAIYFQGAVLDPIQVLDRIEGELGTAVIASNPAMLWFVLSRLGLRYSIAGHGRLLRDWPALP